MAKKAEPSALTVLDGFRGIIQRAGIEQLQYENSIMYGRNSNNASVIIAPQKDLWNAIINDDEMKKMLTEIDPSTEVSKQIMSMMLSATEESDGWIELDTELLYKGKIIKITIDGYEYDVTINRDALPLKLRKAEYNNIRYRIKLTGNPILIIQKEFKSPVSDCDYTMSRIFQVI